MAAEYDFQRKPNPKGDGELQPMYPRIVNKGPLPPSVWSATFRRPPASLPEMSGACWRRWKTASPITFPKGIMYSWVIWGISRRDWRRVPSWIRRKSMRRRYFSARCTFGYLPFSASNARDLWNVSGRGTVSGAVRISVVRNATEGCACF